MLSVSLQSFRGTFERGGEHGQLFTRSPAIPLVQSLVDSWNHYGRVARVLARRVDGMTEPGTMGQTLTRRHQQRALGPTQGLIQVGNVAGRIFLLRQNLR